MKIGHSEFAVAIVENGKIRDRSIDSTDTMGTDWKMEWLVDDSSNGSSVDDDE